MSSEDLTPAQRRAAARRIRVVDFFCGCGGTSAGFRSAGMKIAAGIDNDRDAAASFRMNFRTAKVFREDIQLLDAAKVAAKLAAMPGDLSLFSACAPCQPFTKQRADRKPNDSRAPLLREFERFVVSLEPDLVFVENVPGLQSGAGRHKPFRAFVKALRKAQYHVTFDVINCERYGVPQRRRRLVLMASRLGPVGLPPPTHGGDSGVALSGVWEWIGDLPTLAAGASDLAVADHQAMKLSATNLQRIAATPHDGNRLSWPVSLTLDCHKGEHKGHTDVYGRMPKDRPAPALTTRCISLSNGRFGHPVQDRAISAREAACLQTFSRNFRFAGTLTSRARQIGNAVPVLLARQVGDEFGRHVAETSPA